MDRFNSNEEISFHPEAESQGRIARLNGYKMEKSNPYQINTWEWKSFNAGWADADQGIMGE